MISEIFNALVKIFYNFIAELSVGVYRNTADLYIDTMPSKTDKLSYSNRL